jgi:Lrp/AsnC family transcriptional regulator, leucine-responsive regulatory protein
MPTAGLDAIDMRILRELQKDGRLTVVQLAERVGLSTSPCLRRLKRLERDGIVEGYRAVVSRRAVGLALTVFVGIKVGKHSQENAAALQAALEALPEVVACHMVSGEADFLAEVVVADLAAYERLLTEHLLTLPMVEGIRSNFAMRPIKTNGPLKL